MAGGYTPTSGRGQMPGAARHAWGENNYGSPVDPVYFTRDNITGDLRKIESPQNQQPQATGSIVNIQPKPRFNWSENRDNTQGYHLKKCWEKHYHIWNMVIFQLHTYNLHLESADSRWYEMLQCQETEGMRRNLHQFLDDDMVLYNKILILTTKHKQKDKLLSNIQLPEISAVCEKWADLYNVHKYDIFVLKRLLEVFMILQLQLKEVAVELEQHCRTYQTDLEEMDTSGDNGSLLVPSTCDSIDAHTVKQYESQLHDLREQCRRVQSENRRLQDNSKALETENNGLRMNIQSMQNNQSADSHLVTQYQSDIRDLRKQCENLQRLKQQQEENTKIQMEHIEKVNFEHSKCRENEIQYRKEIASLKSDVAEKVKETKANNQILQKNKTDIQVLTSAIQKQTKTISQYDERYGILQSENNDLKSEYDRLKLEVNNISKEKNRYHSNCLQLLTEKNDINKQYTTLMNHFRTKENEIARRNLEVDELRKEILALKKSKEDILTRLSKVAGAKLTQGNADITDLSDENRPTKIAEKLSELYDNEWTDALEEIVLHTSSEEEAIRLNLEIISTAYKFCSEISQRHADNLMHSLAYLPILPGEKLEDQTTFQNEKGAKVSPEIQKDIEDIRRSLAPQLISVAVERFMNNVEKTIRVRLDSGTQDDHLDVGKYPDIRNASGGVESGYDDPSTDKTSAHKYEEQRDSHRGLLTGKDQNSLHTDKISATSSKHVGRFDKSFFQTLPSTKIFAEKCVNLCWLMRIREPKLHMVCEVEQGVDFNTDIFRHYTRTGKKIAYLVWPVLYLFEKGPLLAKGVAQPMK